MHESLRITTQPYYDASRKLIMDSHDRGYDAQIGGGLLASPQFRKDFGYVSKTGQYIHPADWQAAFNSASSIGGFFGGITCGYVSDRFGRCKTLGLACVISIGAVFIQFFANSNVLALPVLVLPAAAVLALVALAARLLPAPALPQQGSMRPYISIGLGTRNISTGERKMR